MKASQEYAVLFILAAVLICSASCKSKKSSPATPAAPGNTIYVDWVRPDDSGDGLTWATAKKTIQAGIDATDAAPAIGWTVLVADGTYTGTGNKDLNFNGKAIHLVSVGGAENCVIDCENSRRGFYFGSGEDANSVVEGFTIRSSVAGSGGAVCCYYSSPTITNCTFSGNRAYDGGAVYCYDNSSPTITNCTFSGNSADSGGAVYCDYLSSPTITNCTFSQNSAAEHNGGAVYCETSSPTITNCTFSGNSASGNYGCGGAVYFYDSSLTITNCTFSGNSADYGGAVYFFFSSPTVTNCTLSENSASYGGGAVWCDSSSPTVTNCTFSENGAYYDGGAVYCRNSSSPTITNSILWGNSATADGNEIYIYDFSSSVTLNNSDVTTGGYGGKTGNITENSCIHSDPFFVNAAEVNYRLRNTSSCIDAGSNSLLPPAITTDLDGSPRIVDGNNPPDSIATVDIGAYETPPYEVTVAYFTATPKTGTAPLTVQFTDLSIGNITSWEWDFDNNETVDSTDQNPIYIYTNPGGYTVKLTVTGPSNSNSGTKTNYIRVYDGTVYVHGTNGADTNCGTSWTDAVKTIQVGLNLASSGMTVLIADGTYKETGNNNLNFNGKAIHLVSVGGAENCIIDCENSGRSFYFSSGEDADSVVEGFTIRNGVADYGGTVYCYNSSPTITNCTFSENSGEYYGGAVYCYNSSPTITNCTFSENSAAYFGGAVDCNYSSPTITNCIFSGNWAGNGGAVDCGSSTTITNCTFSGNSADWDGGAVSCGSSTTITNCTFSGNSAVETGGAVRCSSSSPIITNCTFSENSAGWIGRGGAVYCGESSPTITNCTFSENSAGWYGGAVFCEFSSSPTITNCTFSRNSAVNYGGAVYCDFSSPTINNSILWNNSATSGGNEIYIFYLPSYPSSVTLNNCDVMSGGYGGETGNITENSCMHPDPLFVDAAGGNYHLQAGSPCIDAGDNSLVPPGVTTDLDGNPRIYPEGGTVDMGAYEYQP